MPVRNTAGPYCGQETLVNVPDRDTVVQKVRQGSIVDRDTDAGCQECGKKFSAFYG